MDITAFEATLNDIYALNNSDGPSHNVFEPKFQARDQAIVLQKTIKNCIKEDPSSGPRAAFEQLARLYLFIGNNMSETEEEKEALVNLLRAYECTACCIAGTPFDISAEPAANLNKVLETDKSLTNDTTAWVFAATYSEVLNSLGVFFANRDDVRQRVDDARRVLHVVETLWSEWDAKHQDTPSAEVPLTAGSLFDSAALLKLQVSDEKKQQIRTRHRMDCIHTSNLFYLAQAYQAKADVRKSSKYCHLTLANQLISRKEFSKKDWATNVLHLSGFYSSEGDFGAAKYCLDAGKYMMPTEKQDEETTGFVAWTFGKFYRNRLRYYGDRKLNAVPYDEHLHRAEWWCDFAIPIPSPTEMKKIDTFEQARDEFKLGMAACQEALKYYIFDGCCTDHIAIHQDMNDLYNRLMVFEPDFLRQIAMQMRRVDLVKSWHPQLSFNAYGTLVRQLLFDLGDLTSDLLDMRIKQREQKQGKCLSDKHLNELQQRSQKCFIDFIESFREGGKLPSKLDKELRSPFFRALMRIARLETRKAFKDPQAEYDAINLAIKRYEDVIRCAEVNNLEADPDLAVEVKMARDLSALLPTKQREIWRAFNSK